MIDSDQDFEAFWKHFLADHPSAANRWARVGALFAGVGGLELQLPTPYPWWLETMDHEAALAAFNAADAQGRAGGRARGAHRAGR